MEQNTERRNGCIAEVEGVAVLGLPSRKKTKKGKLTKVAEAFSFFVHFIQAEEENR